MVNSRFSERPCLKKYSGEEKRKTLSVDDLWPPHVCTCRQRQTDRQPDTWVFMPLEKRRLTQKQGLDVAKDAGHTSRDSVAGLIKSRTHCIAAASV